ncbi:MAG: hypothetical protein KME55_09580 [Nostoc indistinguendum CM1-VF10]|jgi:membrane glycosyltransferase|nr:hypothetical protein [Nostoc indistinguendum CM1-VF10]
MRWKQLMILFISTIVFLFTGNAIAQTDLNINNTNLIQLGGNVTVVEKQVVENAIAIVQMPLNCQLHIALFSV